MVIFFNFPILHAQQIEQQVVASSGGIAAGTGGTAAWTVGEMVIVDTQKHNNTQP